MRAVVLILLCFGSVFYKTTQAQTTKDSVVTFTQEQLDSLEKTEGFFTLIETMPQFPGGMEALAEYLSNETSYPKEAREAGIEGKVYVEFTVSSTGAIVDVGLKEDYDIGGGCGDEAIRVVKKMPEWEPGVQKGEPVAVRMVLPITFKLTEKDKSK